MNRKKRILCFGDSLTWGFDPESMTRFNEDNRWTMVLQDILGSDYTVVEEGQCGRLIAKDDPVEGEKNGLKYIVPCLESHVPLDLVIIMLGDNDCQQRFGHCALDIEGEMQIFLEKVISFNHLKCNNNFEILLVSQPPILESVKDSWMADFFDHESVVKISAELPVRYNNLAKSLGCRYLNAADYVTSSKADGCHLDAENQRKLGRVIADYIKNDLNSLEK